MAFDNRKGRAKANEEVKIDLKKSVEQLLTDVHEEILFNSLHEEEIQKGNIAERTIEENMLHASKRLASLQAKISIRMERLVWGTIAIAMIALIVSVIALFGSQCSCG